MDIGKVVTLNEAVPGSFCIYCSQPGLHYGVIVNSQHENIFVEFLKNDYISNMVIDNNSDLYMLTDTLIVPDISKISATLRGHGYLFINKHGPFILGFVGSNRVGISLINGEILASTSGSYSFGAWSVMRRVADEWVDWLKFDGSGLVSP
jgi:hypothetical protein